MPECLLFAYAEQKPRLEALRLRDMSMVAAYPHMTKQGAQGWIRALTRAAQRTAQAAATAFTLNGQPISTGRLRRRFAQVFGTGFTDD